MLAVFIFDVYGAIVGAIDVNNAFAELEARAPAGMSI